MIKALISMGMLTSSICFSSLNFVQQLKHTDVFDTNCCAKYVLEIEGNHSKLVEKETGYIVNTFNGGSNPFLKNKLGFSPDYLVYNNDGTCNKYLGVYGNKLFDLVSNREISISIDRSLSINNSLQAIEYSNIPSTAIHSKYSYYFKNLKEDGFGENKVGTCALVAMQILFDYYDSIWSDFVIEELYDSPVSEGKINCESFSTSPASKAEQFHSYLINFCNNSLNISIANRGLSNSEQFQLINSYIGSTRALSYQVNTSEGNLSDILSGKQFDVVKNGIKAGRPVILNTLHHSMVAFAYDDNYAYVMSGWYGEKIISKLSWNDFNGNIFSNACGAYDLILTSTHSCSNNYKSTIYGKYICPRGDL